MPEQPKRIHDVVVVGGGSAGYAAARTAHEQGANVGIVDHGPLGGLCILRGCMPTKTILRSAEVMALMRRAKEFGLSPVEVKADLSSIVDRKNRLVGEFAADRIAALQDSRFRLYQLPGRFVSPTRLQVGEDYIEGNAFIIATGSVASELPIPGLQEAGYYTSDTLLDLREQPGSLIVLGGGPVAVEFGQFFARIGTRVTILQRADYLLSYMDPDIGDTLREAFREEGIEVQTGVRVDRVSREGRLKTVHFECDGKARTVSGEAILQAWGRRPNIDSLNLAAAGVSVESDRIVVGPDLRTSQPHIFAVGDVNYLNPIVHIAIQQGEAAAYNATHPHQTPKVVDNRLDAEVVFTDPQVAVVGASERDCRTREHRFLSGSYRFADHGKAMALGQTHGFVKLLCELESGELIGAQIVGPEAGELIHELIAVMYYHGTAHDLLRMPHYHPTLAEIVTYPAESVVAQLSRS